MCQNMCWKVSYFARRGGKAILIDEMVPPAMVLVDI